MEASLSTASYYLLNAKYHLVCFPSAQKNWIFLKNENSLMYVTFSSVIGNNSLEGFPSSPEDPCTEPDKMCDFHADCAGEKDEAKCGEYIHPVWSNLHPPAGL